MPEINTLREELELIRSEIKAGFEDISRWRTDVDTATMGLSKHGVWGYQQKIEYNKQKISALETRQSKLELTLQKHLGVALGVGAVGGGASAIIFNLIIKLM